MGRRVARRSLSLLAACAWNLHPPPALAQGGEHEFREVHLGMEMRLVLAHVERAAAERLARRAFDQVEELEQIFSDWRPASEVRRLEGHAAGAWLGISAPLRDVLALALAIATASDGVFDPTVGPLTALWREASRTGRPIADSDRARALARVGYRFIELDSANRRVRFHRAGMRLDLGAIAKGWVLDRVVAMVRDSVSGVLAEAGGDLVVAGSPPGASGWRILVRTARGDSTLVLSEGAVSSSGPMAQKIVSRDGGEEGHVVDPRTGRGAAIGPIVVVVGPRGAVTDGLATALALTPPDRRARLAARFGVVIVGT